MNKFFITDDVYPPFIGLNRTGNKILSLEVENPLDINTSGFTIYKYLDSGGNGAVYLTDADLVGDNSLRDVIKIQPISSPEREAAFKREIEFQDRAARTHLAPAISKSGFIKFSDGVIGYVEMERVKNFIHLYQTENPIKKAFACDYIKKLSGIGLINTKDPRNHFYTDKGKLKMIDFGEVEDISSLTPVRKREKMNEMEAALGIICHESEFRGGKKKRKTRRKNKKTKNRKTRQKKNFTRNFKIKFKK